MLSHGQDIPTPPGDENPEVGGAEVDQIVDAVHSSRMEGQSTSNRVSGGLLSLLARRHARRAKQRAIAKWEAGEAIREADRHLPVHPPPASR